MISELMENGNMDYFHANEANRIRLVRHFVSDSSLSQLLPS